MLKRIKNGGILALVLAAGLAVLQPLSAEAADRHNGGGDREGGRVERNWNHDRGFRERVYHNYAPARNYYAPAPRYERRYDAYPGAAYGYGDYPVCPR